MEAMMHKYFKTQQGVILIWQLTESKEELFQQLDGQTIDLLEYEKLKNERRQVEYLGTRIALKNLLNKKIDLFHTSEGKPYLKDESYQISISHSQQWIAVIAHPNLTVGIDIECFQPKILKLYERFLNEEELRYFGDEKNIRKLTLIWSAKEVIYKIIGSEAVNFSHQIQVLPFKLKESGEIRTLHIPSEKIFRLHYNQTNDYVLVYGAVEKTHKEKIEK